MTIGIILAIIAAVGGPIIAYLAAARRLSGRIDTSEAAQLWEEAGKLRYEYKTEVTEMREILTKLRLRVEDLELKNDALHLENGELRSEVIRLRSENTALKRRVSELEKERDERT